MNIQINATIATTIKNVIMESSSAIVNSLLHPWHFEHGHRQVNAGYDQTLREFGPNSSRQEFADHFTVLANTAFSEYENLLHGHDLALHSGDFGDADHFSSSIAEAAHLNHHVQGGCDLTPNRGVRNV